MLEKHTAERNGVAIPSDNKAKLTVRVNSRSGQSEVMVEAEFLVDAALAGHAHYHLGAGACRAGYFHISLLNKFIFRFVKDNTDRLPKCNHN